MGISLWTMISAIVSVPMSNTNLEIRVGSCTIKKKTYIRKKRRFRIQIMSTYSFSANEWIKGGTKKFPSIDKCLHDEIGHY